MALTPCVRAAETGEQAVALETVVVTANRVEQRPLDVSASVTALNARELERAGITSVKEASLLTPNVNVIEFSARAISNPQFRGVGGSPTNPGVTTYLDGVPQLNADTSSQALLDIERIEFVRGSQGTLYGRNTLGGVINIASRLPSKQWKSTGTLGLGDFAQREAKIGVSGPLLEGLGAALAAGTSARDGYSLNDSNGQRLDSRSARYGKGQLLWRIGERWQLRAIATVENADDGDFPLGDLAMLRARPLHVRHNFTGFTRRDLDAQTLTARYRGEHFTAESISGRGHYTAFETTDLDTGDEENLTRRNGREGMQTTQELRFSATEPLQLGSHLTLKWQAGLFGFLQGNDQAVVNFIPVDYLVQSGNSFLGLPADVPQPVLDALAAAAALPNAAPAEDRTNASLDDKGLGGYGEATLGWGRWQATLGARYDVEIKAARIRSGTVLPTAAGELPVSTNPDVDQSRHFSDFTPKGVLAYAPSDRARLYASVAAGYRAGGFNPASPVDKVSYREEHSLSTEVGGKARWLGGRLSTSVAVFHIDLRDLQLNVPIAGGAGRFYIDNTGSARNYGAELEASAALSKTFSLFGNLGYLDARFGQGSTVLGTDGSNTSVDVSGNRIPFGDRLTGLLGGQYNWRFGREYRLLLRGEVVQAGGYFYDATNGPRQASYQLVNLRAGFGGKAWRLEGWVRNALDEATIPLAIPYTGIAPSGYVGESGAPRTLGLNFSVNL